MSKYDDLDAAAQTRITTLDDQATAAINEVDAQMETIRALSELLAPYYTPAAASYTATEFDTSGVSKPTFNELDNADDALAEAATLKLDTLSAGSSSIHSTLKKPLDDANTGLENVWSGILASIPAKPTVPFKEDDFVGDIIAGLQTQLSGSLSNAAGSSSAQESTYYTRDAARRAAIRKWEEDATINDFASRGFDLPAECKADMRTYIRNKQGMSEADRQRQVILQQSTLSLANKQKAIDAGLRYDQILIGFFERKAQRAFQLAASGLKLLQDLADMKFYVLQQRMAVQKDYLDMTQENQQVVIQEFEQNLKAFSERFDALVSQAGGYLGAYQAEGEVFGIRKRAIGENRRFVLSEADITLDTLKWNVANALKAFADNADAFDATAKIRLGAAKAGADVQIGVASAARSSIMTIVGMLTDDQSSTSASS